MDPLHKLTKKQERDLHKSLMLPPGDMVRAKDLIVSIIHILSTSHVLHHKMRQTDLTSLVSKLFGTHSTDINMKITNKKTYQYLFGFNNHARNYIDCSGALKKNHARRSPITAYHAYCICFTLSKLELVSDMGFPILIDPLVQVNHEDVLEFLQKALRQLTYLSNKKDSMIDYSESAPQDFFMKKAGVNTHLYEKQDSVVQRSQCKNQYFFNVPPRTIPVVRQSNYLEQIRRHVFPRKSGSCKTFIITGASGVGKTALAVEFAHQFKSEFVGVLWCTAENKISLINDLASLACHLEIASPTDNDRFTAALKLLKELSRKKEEWLLIFDGAVHQSLIKDIEVGGSISLIVTCSSSSVWENHNELLELQHFTLDQSLSLFQDHLIEANKSEVEKLLTELYALPLLLSKVATFCQQTSTNIGEYIDLIHRYKGDNLERISLEDSIKFSMNLIMASLIKEEEIHDVLEALAHFPSVPVSIEVFRMLYRSLSITEFDSLCNNLVKLGIFEIREDIFGNKLFCIHELVRGAIGRSKKKGQGSSHAVNMLDYFFGNYGTNLFSNNSSRPDEYIHTCSLILQVYERDINQKWSKFGFLKTFTLCGLDMFSAGQFSIGEKMIKYADEIIKQEKALQPSIEKILSQDWRINIKSGQLDEFFQNKRDKTEMDVIVRRYNIDWGLFVTMSERTVNGNTVITPDNLDVIFNRFVNTFIMLKGPAYYHMYALLCTIVEICNVPEIYDQFRDLYMGIKNMYSPETSDSDFADIVWKYEDNRDFFPMKRDPNSSVRVYSYLLVDA